MPKNELELKVWTDFATAALGGAMAERAGAWKGAVKNAASAADELLAEWRQRESALRTQ